MRHYIGIDLGTTNSVIASYDGRETHIYKSPEQNDVTPSAIYVDRRGHRFFGSKAFELSAGSQKNSATLFKRYMGTNKTFSLGKDEPEITPVDCSAMLLRHLFSYLPEEIRKDPDTVTVITVPAAFNQMKKDATLEAAEKAGIGQAALMQEPVAAVMSVLKKDDSEKKFIVYDLGGGTFDVSVAEHRFGRVSLLAQGGREMCGGRDWDRKLFEARIAPWLRQTFDLPEEFDRDPAYASLVRLSLRAAEQAKIELSRAETAYIQLDEDKIRLDDLSGEQIYLDILLRREDLQPLVDEMAEDTCAVTREVMQKAGVSSSDISQIIFIGGPTMYRPLQEKVCSLLSVAPGTEVNPMTAVAEGAAVFAESIDWESETHGRKASFEERTMSGHIRLHYEARTASPAGQIAFLSDDEEEYTAEVSSDDEGDFQETVSFRKNTIITVPLGEPGEYLFRVSVCDGAGTPVTLKDNVITITRTLASVQAIPASHSIAVKVLDRQGGKPVPVWLVHQNDPLPHSGSITFRAGQRLVGGSDESLLFTLWEGEIEDPVEDNLYIGTYRIPGTLFRHGYIPAGAEIICRYEVNEAGNLHLGAEIPCVDLNITDRSFYSRAEGQVDLLDTSDLLAEAGKLQERVSEISQKVFDAGLYRLKTRLVRIRAIAQRSEDPEQIQDAWNALSEIRREVARVRKEHQKEIRKLDLEKKVGIFSIWEESANLSEKARFRSLKETAEAAIAHGSSEFESLIREMNRLIITIAWRDDNVVTHHFYSLCSINSYKDPVRFQELKKEGLRCIDKQDHARLRMIVNQIGALEVTGRPPVDTEEMFEDVNILRS